eukprot:810180_1
MSNDTDIPDFLEGWIEPAKISKVPKHEAIAYCDMKLSELIEQTKSFPENEALATRVSACCQLLKELSASMPRFASVMNPMLEVIFESIYQGYENRKPEDFVPFFKVVEDLENEQNSLTGLKIRWEEKRKRIEENGIRRTLVIDIAARNWQSTILHHAFSQWRHTVKCIKHQRTVLMRAFGRWNEDPFLVYVTFLKWKIQTQRSRNSIISSKIHNLFDRNKQISDKTNDLEETIRNDENEYNKLSEKMNTLKDEKQMYDKQLAGLQSELDKHSSELNVIDATNRILSIASECVSVLHSEVLHLWRSNPVDPCQLLPGKSIEQAENILSNMSAQNLLVSWVNFHAKRGNHELEIGNFASD